MAGEGQDVRWVLGFDGGCAVCTGLARQIEAVSAGRLTARSLHDPEVQVWRRQALGDDAPWLPTLFAVRGAGVRAWTRAAMAARLGRLLGPLRMWRIMSLLGAGGGRAGTTADPGRRRFVKALGGAALAATVLAGVRTPAAGATAGSGTPLAGEELGAVLGVAMGDPATRALRADIERRGYRFSQRYSRGFVGAEGDRSLLLIFEAARGGKDHAVLRWGQLPSGRSGAQGELIQYLGDPPPGADWVTARRYLRVTPVAATGRPGGAGGGGSIVSPMANTSEQCFWDHMLGCCGPGAVGCAFAGPAWPECMVVVCAFCINYANFACLVLG